MSGVTQAILHVMDDLSKIGLSKDRKNQQQGFMYRGVDELMNVLAPILVKNRLLILPRTLEREQTERLSKGGGALFCVVLKTEYEFVCVEDDSFKIVGPFFGEAMDSADKATNKAMSIAYKYACFETFCIPTEADNDPDDTTHEVAVPKAHPAPKTAAAPATSTWDGTLKLGFSQKYKEHMWKDVPQDFLDWCLGANLAPARREVVELEAQRRRDALEGGLEPEMPEAFYADNK